MTKGKYEVGEHMKEITFLSYKLRYPCFCILC